MLVNSEPKSADVQHLQVGIYQINHFNGEYLFDVKEKYPNFPEWRGSYGVCDSAENLLEVRGEDLNDPNRKFIIVLTEVGCDPSNGGNGGGWRWHKWGEYIGAHDIQCEYLDDEEGIDSVFCYRILEVE